MSKFKDAVIPLGKDFLLFLVELLSLMFCFLNIPVDASAAQLTYLLKSFAPSAHIDSNNSTMAGSTSRSSATALAMLRAVAGSSRSERCSRNWKQANRW